MYGRPKEKTNPYGKKEVKIEKKSSSRTAAGQKPIAKDTNKTRRKKRSPTIGQIK